jgi:TonB-linked SusC/RagA family outer membrane protein
MIRQCRRLLAGALCALGMLPAIAAAQNAPGGQAGTGIITGRVTDAGNRAPLPGVTVLVIGTQRGTLTTADGTFRIVGVPAGAAQVRAQRIGFAAVVRPVTVTAGGTATVEFALAAAAVQLDAVVTSATGETQRARETGNAVSTIDSSRLNTAVNANFAQTLAAKAPGVNISQGSGTTGSGSRIRIRGSNSVNLSNEPLLIIDGVRINNNPQSSTGAAIGVGGQTISRVNDINPEDIENIEVIKGPAAAALYGTAASNGVIQVTTKRGRPGTARWNTFAEYGVLNDPYEYPSNFANVGTFANTPTATNPATTVQKAGCTIELQVRPLTQGGCTNGQVLSFNPLETYKPYENGFRNQYGLSVSGGREGATYYVGGDFEREQGLVDPNNLKRANFRVNLDAAVNDKVTLALRTGYLSSRQGLPQNENNGFGYLSAGLLGKAGDCSPSGAASSPFICGTGATADTISYGYFSTLPRTFFAINARQNIEKFTGGLTANYQPLTWLRGTFTGGLDAIARLDRGLLPSNVITTQGQANLQGFATDLRAQEFTYTGTGSLIATYPIREGLEATSSLGGQYIRESLFTTFATGANLLAGSRSLRGASAQKDVDNRNEEIVTIGGFGEQRFAYRDRLFLSAALRADDNSAFGQGADLVYYPSTSLSYVISEEPFFPKIESLGQLRLRTAYGKSGQRPGFRQAETFFSPVAVATAPGSEQPAAIIGGTGNPTLRPEISREYEFGFDAGFFGERLGINFTTYNKRTNEALVSVPLAPSLALTASQFRNLGATSNRGAELGINATAFDTRPAKLDLTVSYSTNRNRLEDIGVNALGEPLPAIVFNNATQRHQEGYALGGYWGRTIKSFEDKDANGIISRTGCRAYGAQGVAPTTQDEPTCEIVLSDTAEYLGSPLPTRELSVNPALTLFKNVRLQALVDYRGGYRLWNQSREFRCFNFQQCQDIVDPTTPVGDQAKVIARALNSSAGYIEDASFTRLREVSVTFTAPEQFARRLRTAGLSLTVGGQNLATWSDYTGFDPEVQAGASAVNTFTSVDFFSQAPVRRFNTRLNVTF